jgi:DNA-binding response OmpR family regulator
LAAVLVRRWNVPCLFVSGEMAEAKEHRDLALGYICKPYDPSTVLAAIDVRCRPKPSGRQQASCHSARPGTFPLNASAERNRVSNKLEGLGPRILRRLRTSGRPSFGSQQHRNIAGRHSWTARLTFCPPLGRCP